MSGVALEPGAAAPLGASFDGAGVNFAVFSRHADRIELCLFDWGHTVETRVALPARTGDVRHGYLRGAAPGLRYAYSADGSALLLDPYARELADGVCRVHAPRPTIERPPKPRTPWRDTVLYELHVRGFSRLLDDVPERVRGTLAALVEPAALAHFRAIGVTALELMPIAAFADEPDLARRGLRNYWGYNPIALFAVHPPYEGPLDFAAVVDRLHAEGLEVILDFVLNHTAEGDALGPTLAFRGLDDETYYRADARGYVDFSGCGNTLDFAEPAVVTLALDAMRHWAVEIGVDGFRLDLAAALARDRDGAFDAGAPLLRAIASDPDLSRCKIIVEPWDAGHPGYFLGRFPPAFAEWNDRFRDGVRHYWRGEPGAVAELATRLAGSQDLLAAKAHGPFGGVAYVTSHDGFTLADLVSYARKRNEANGEDNLDGPPDHATLCIGAEGATDDEGTAARRRALRRALLATLFLARGVPMLLAGDELSRTQRGNNNAYCQDNALSWIDWSARDDPARDLREFVGELAALRRRLRGWRGERFLLGGTREDELPQDVRWLRPDGARFEDADWHDPGRHALAVLFVDHAPADGAHRAFVACFNASGAPSAFALPVAAGVASWARALDSASDDALAAAAVLEPHEAAVVEARALAVFVPADELRAGRDARILEAARSRGLHAEYVDAGGTVRVVRERVLRQLLDSLGAAPPAVAATAPSPGRCFEHPLLARAPGCFALSVQLYGLASAQSWGVGDFEDLARLAETAAAVGAAAVMIGPQHAGFLGRPERASPYAPSSRHALNALAISVPRAAGDEPCAAYAALIESSPFRDALERARRGPLVDYAAVAALKREALEVLHRELRHDADAPRRFAAFRAGSGAALRRYAIFEALSEHLGEPDWRGWPAEFRDAGSPAVARFAYGHAGRVEFFEYLQWLAREQWDAACARARAAGLPIGIIGDIAVGAAPDGAEAWSDAALLMSEVEIGAPPDPLGPRGQTWGAPPFQPERLRALGCAPFRDVLRASMRGAGGVRIDHVMALARLFLVPRGAPATRGTYLDYPLEDLLAAVAQESLAQRCLVIGEDLGTVPATLRRRLDEAGMLGYRVIHFERTPDGGYRDPASFPAASAAALGTHDLPTIAAFLAAADIDERERLHLFPSATAGAEAREDRDRSVAALRSALRAARIDGFDVDPVAALHRFLATAGSRLAIVQLEDLVGAARQPNLPGLGDVAPNWRQRLPVTIEDLRRDPRFLALRTIMSARAATRDRTSA